MSKAGLRGLPLRIGKYVVAMLPVAFAVAWLDHRFFPEMHSLWRLTGFLIVACYCFSGMAVAWNHEALAKRSAQLGACAVILFILLPLINGVEG